MKQPPPAHATTRIRPDIITDDYLETLRAHGVVEAYLFGSFSRGEERPDSDIDLLVTFPSPKQFLLAEKLRRLSGHRVDIAINLHPAFAPYILPTLVPLPL